jgi:hypothetical protein
VKPVGKNSSPGLAPKWKHRGGLRKESGYGKETEYSLNRGALRPYHIIIGGNISPEASVFSSIHTGREP